MTKRGPAMLNSRIKDRGGFTLIEIVIAVAIVAIFAAALSPMVFRHLEDSKVAKAQSESKTIATAILSYYKDTGEWPVTDADGPSGRNIIRIISSASVPTTGTGAEASAVNWGTFGNSKQLGDYLYYNNPDDDSSATGADADESNEDWPTAGPRAWKGPYVESYDFNDPWGNAYVVNSVFFPNGLYAGTVRHNVFVLSAGPNGKWETAFIGPVTEEIIGDDIGSLVMSR